MYSQNEVPRINVIDKDTKTDSQTIQNCSQKKSIYYLLMAIFITLIIITVIGVVWRFAKNYFSLESKPDTDTPKIGCKNTKNCCNFTTKLLWNPKLNIHYTLYSRTNNLVCFCNLFSKCAKLVS